MRVVHTKKLETGDYFLGAHFDQPLTAAELKPFVVELSARLCLVGWDKALRRPTIFGSGRCREPSGTPTQRMLRRASGSRLPESGRVAAGAGRSADEQRRIRESTRGRRRRGPRGSRYS